MVIWAAVVALMAGSLAFAHENHDQLGAGPGPAAGAAKADEKADAVDAAGMSDPHMKMGSMSSADMNMGGRDIAGDDMDMGHMEEDRSSKSFGERLTSWLGRLHTLAVHFPIAMFIGAFGVELYGLWKRNRDLQHVAFIMLIVGAVGAVGAAALGWFAGGFYLTDRNAVLMIHRWLGTAIAVFGLVLVYLTARSRRSPERPRTVYWGILGLLVIAIGIQGYLGGTFMHGGLDHLAF